MTLVVHHAPQETLFPSVRGRWTLEIGEASAGVNPMEVGPLLWMLGTPVPPTALQAWTLKQRLPEPSLAAAQARRVRASSVWFSPGGEPGRRPVQVHRMGSEGSTEPLAAIFPCPPNPCLVGNVKASGSPDQGL